MIFFGPLSILRFINTIATNACHFSEENCDTCKDNAAKNCRDCGCNICSKKTDPARILLCDECNKGYHLACLDPPLLELPTEEEWYTLMGKADDFSSGNACLFLGIVQHAKRMRMK